MELRLWATNATHFSPAFSLHIPPHYFVPLTAGAAHMHYGALAVLGGQGHDNCWSGDFTADSCCISPEGKHGGNPLCWDSFHTFERCCLHQTDQHDVKQPTGQHQPAEQWQVLSVHKAVVSLSTYPYASVDAGSMNGSDRFPLTLSFRKAACASLDLEDNSTWVHVYANEAKGWMLVAWQNADHKFVNRPDHTTVVMLPSEAATHPLHCPLSVFRFDTLHTDA